MAVDGASVGPMAGMKRSASAFHWVSPSPSPAEVASLEALFPSVVRLPSAELEAEVVSWEKNAVLVRTYQRWVPAAAIVREMRRAGIKGRIDPISLAFRCHIIRFEDPKVCDLVLNRPWVINGQVLGMESWKPEFVPAEDAISSALIWVRLPNLPMEFWREDFLRAILEPAGRFIAADDSTLARSRGGFARASIRVDLSRPLRPGARIQGSKQPFWQQFAYEALEGVCPRCGSLHLQGPCSQSVAAGEDDAATGIVFGSWIAAVRQRRVHSGVQREGSRKGHDGQGVSGASSGAHVQQPCAGESAGVAEGWSLPVKVARRRVPASTRVSLIPDQGSCEALLKKPEEVRRVVPAQRGRAGPQCSEKGNKVTEKGEVGELGLTHLNQNPFGSLGLLLSDDGHQQIREVLSGPLKRARPAEGQVPRQSSYSEKRKGKAKAMLAKNRGVNSPGSVIVPPLSIRQVGVKEVALTRVEEVGVSSVDDSDSANMALSSASHPLDPGDMLDLRVGSSMVAEGGTSSLGCLSDTVMVEDQGVVPVSSTL